MEKFREMLKMMVGLVGLLLVCQTIAAAQTLSFTSLTPSTISTSTAPYDAMLSAGGTNFNNVNRVTFTWSGAASGSAIWDRGTTDWNNKVTVNSNTSMTLRPRVVETSPTWSGTVTWTVTLRDVAGATASRSFTVTYTPPPDPLSFTSLTPSTISTSTAPYDATLSASGTNFNNVNRVTFTWSGAVSGSATWDIGSSDWNNKVTVNSNTSMTLRPRVVETSPTWSGTVTWTVTLRDVAGATASQSFTVIYTPAGVQPTVTTSSATSITTSSATLNGTVNPNGSSTTAWFEWGTSSSLSTYSSTPSQSVGSGTSSTSISYNLTGLNANTAYYYRTAASNSAGTSRGSIVTFTTTTSQPFQLNLSGISHLYWPFTNSTYVNPTTGINNWVVTCGAGCGGHLGGDYYADDWARLGGEPATCNQPVNSPLRGTVIFASVGGEPLAGMQVVVRSLDNPNFAFRVAHLDVISVSVGQTVIAGTKLGEVGKTGSDAYRCHAHCVLYKNIDQTYSGMTGLSRLQQGYGFGFSGSANIFAAPYYFDATEAPSNNPPNIPTAVNQHKSDGTTSIPEGGTTNESTVIFKGTVSDADGDQVKLQTELRQTTESFSTYTWESSLVSSGTSVSWTRGGLVNASYKWRYRAVDSKGATSSWAEFGTAGNTDFVVNVTQSGTIVVNATLNGSSWSGSVSYRLTGAQTVNGTNVPQTFTNQPPGSYTLSYLSGGPSGATFRDITPSSTQTLAAGGTITFTMNFTTTALSITRVGTNNIIIGSNERQWISIYGSGFVSNAVVTLRTTNFSRDIPQDRTKFISANEIQVNVNLTADPASWSTQVTNPNGTASNVFPFSVVAPVPEITSIDPLSRTAGSSGFTLTVSGKEFNSTSVVQWNGSNRSTQRIPDANGFIIQLQASISASDINAVGKAKITVFNPPPAGGTSPSVDFNIVPSDKGTLAVQVKNINGASSPVPGANGIVEMYSSASQLISTQATNASGLATFSNVATSAGYSLKVYHSPPANTTIFGKEYWGRKSSINITAGATLNESLVRNMPYSLALRAYNSATNEDVTTKTITSGATVRLELTIQNPSVEGSSTQSVRGRLVLDRNNDSNYDFDQASSGSQTVQPGSSTRFLYTFAPQNSGQYYFAVAALTMVDGRDVVTDGWQWSSIPLFTVGDVSGPTVISTNPRNGDIAAPVTNTLTATFNKDLQSGSLSVRVVDQRNAAVAIRSRTVNGSTLTLSLESTLAYSTGYAVSIDAGAVKDLAGNPNAAYSWAFVTAAPDAPQRPTLAAPLDNSTNLTSPVTLRWNAVDRATSYVVQVGKDLSFTDKVFEQAVQSTSVSVTLDQGTLYFWRVVAAVNQAVGPWSSAWRFTTASIVGQKLVISSITPSTIQERDRGESAEYVVTVTDQNNNPVAGATITGQDEIRRESFNEGPTASDGTTRYRTANIPLDAGQGAIYNITFKAVKSGFTESAISSRQVRVVRQQIPPASISVSQASLNFEAQHSGELPSAQVVTISNAGGQAMNWEIGDIPDWLDVNPSSGSLNPAANVPVQVRPKRTNLDPLHSPYSAMLQVRASNAANSPKTINVRYEIKQTSTTQLTFGSITIYANSITDISSALKRATGNVNLNHLLNFSGPIDIRVSDLTVTGDCEIYMENVPRPTATKVTIYDGAFQFRISGQERKLAGFSISSARDYLTLAGFKTKPQEINFTSDGIIMNAHLDFSSVLGFEGDVSSLEITKTSGVRIISPISASYLTLSNGIVLVNLRMLFDPFKEKFDAQGLVKVALFQVDAGFAMMDGSLDRVYWSADLGVDIPIGKETGHLSLYGLGGGIYGLAKPPTRVNLTGDFSFIHFPLSLIIDLEDVDLNYTLPSSLSGTGTFKVFKIFPVGNAYVILNPFQPLFNCGGGVNLGGILVGQANFAVMFYPNPLLEGSITGKLQIPDGTGLIYELLKAGGITFPFVVTGQEAHLRNFKASGSSTLLGISFAYGLDFEPVLNGQLLPKFELGLNAFNLNLKLFKGLVNPDLVLNGQDRFEGLSLVISEHSLNNFLRKGTAGTLHQIIPLREEVSQVIFRLRGSTLLPQTTLVLPNGTKVNRTDAGENRVTGISYVEDAQGRQVFWIIDKPAKGDWRIEIGTGTTVSLDVIGFALPTGIHITEPSSDRTSGRIEWIDSGLPDSARISLYYDRDNQGLDGVLIAQNIRPTNAKNSYPWNYAGVPAGSYYIYAIIEDGRNAPVSSYSPARIIVPSSVSPPSTFEATVVDTSIELRWIPPPSGPVVGYLIKYKDIRDTDYRSSFTVRDTNRISISGLVPGRNYQFAISAIDPNNNLSTETVSNLVSFVSLASNNPPIIRFRPENASQAKVWRPYSAKVDADDADNDNLLFSLVSSPAAVNINSSTGEISWTPSLEQIGNQRINVRVSDGRGGSDSLSYAIGVSEPARPSITFARGFYSDSVRFAIITISDQEANLNSLEVEEISTILKTPNASTTITCRETGANTGAFNTALDLSQFTLTSGDSISLTYFNKVGELISTSAQWTSSSQKFWQSATLLEAGIIYALAASSSGTIFAGTSDRGVFQSTDHGNTWKQRINGLTYPTVHSLAISRTGHIFAGTSSGEIFRSTDAGELWTRLVNLGPVQINAIAINSKGYVYAGTTNGFFRSTDNGGNWGGYGNGLFDAYTSIAIDSSGNIFAGTFGGGIFRSTNNGNNWVQMNVGLTDLNVRSLTITTSGDIFAGTSKGGIFRSTQNGQSWTQTNTDEFAGVSVNAITSSHEYIFAGTSGKGVVLSTDKGNTWTQMTSGLTNLDIQSLAISPVGYIFAGTTRGTIFRSSQIVVSVQEEHPTVPLSFALFQNYPNPFNPMTTIEYALPTSAKVSIKVYNLLGQEVSTLVNVQQQAGRHQVEWQAHSGVASGIYFYRIEAVALDNSARRFVETKKMLLIR